MDVKDLLISVDEFHSAMKEAHVRFIVANLVQKKREELEKMLPAFLYKNAKERQSDIEKMMIFYEWGLKDGINEFIKHKERNYENECAREDLSL